MSHHSNADHSGDVRLLTARSLAEEVWGRNPGRDAIDAANLVHAARAAAERSDQPDGEPFTILALTGGEAVLKLLFPAV